ncbi:MAG TPA: Ppx/GppA phosphatase family protein [Myxococcota bacterium]|nr:Ppx/GppA phosphatase family protein [Myxococcota bacterium]
MTRFATLDIGTNSQLLLVAERDERGDFHDLLDRAVVTRLGLGLERTGSLQLQTMEHNLDQIRVFLRLCSDMGVDKIAAAGTLCLRKAKNAGDFLREVERETGIRIEVVSGEEEARLTFIGVRSGLPAGMARPLVFDLGGGSCEFILGQDGRIERRFSLEVGAVRMTDRFLPSDPAAPGEIDSLRSHLDGEALVELTTLADFQSLVGVGGTVTTLGAMHLELEDYRADRIQGMELARADIDGLCEKLAFLSVAERKRLSGLDPKRADVILAGALIVQRIVHLLGAGGLVVSDRGLRHGLMQERFGPVAARDAK